QDLLDIAHVTFCPVPVFYNGPAEVAVRTSGITLLACRTRETIRLRLIRLLTNLAVNEQYRSDATERLPKGRTYGKLADGARRAQGPRGRPAEPGHRGVGETLAVRRLDRPRRAGPHGLGRQADAARVLRKDGRLRVQLRQGPGEGRRRQPGRVPGRHAGQLRVGADLGEAPAGPDTDLAGRDDRAQRGHPPGPRRPAQVPHRPRRDG